MKKRKITYSMTARQKKQLKQQQENEQKNEQKNEANLDSDANIGETEGQARPKKRGLIISLTAGVLAIALIVIAICLPIITSNETITNDTFLKWKTYNSKDPEHPFDDENPNPNPPANPIITFTLYSDDKAAFKEQFGVDEVTLKFELFMDDAPYSSINLIYLAESGFYDDTIINDVKKGHAMISGFTKAADKENKAYKVDFIEKLKGFTDHTVAQINNSDFKLGYRLSAERKRNDEKEPFGSLIMLAGTSSSGGCSSTAYVFVTRDNSPQFDDLMSNSGNMSWMGKLTADDGNDQHEMLRKLNGVNTLEKGKFYVPTFDIKIKSARSNLSSAQIKYLLNNFESLIKDGKGSTWRNNSYSSSDYKF